MLIQALCEYHDVLSSKGKLVPEGYSSVDISYLICLTAEGKIDNIIDCRKKTLDTKSKKPKEILVPQSMLLPKRTEKTAIDANIVEHRPLYIFGLNYDGKEQCFAHADSKAKAKKSHEECVKVNLSFMEGLNEPICVAYKAFLQNWKPEEEEQNRYLLNIGKEFTTARFAFCLSGRPDILLHESMELRQKWEKAFSSVVIDEQQNVAQCGILGEKLPIARIHDKIRHIPGGSAMGNTLISFNNPSEYSYGHEQSFNSNVSEHAMVKYTQALNYLMDNPKHRTLLDDVTIFHWASSDEEKCDALMRLFMMPDTLDALGTEKAVGAIIRGLEKGIVERDVDELLQGIDPNVVFYMVGFKPNSARIAVKFIYRQQFGHIMRNVLQHQLDMKLEGGEKPIPLKWICREMIPPKSSQAKGDPTLMTKLLEVIISGHNYPDAVFASIIRRIRMDRDEEDNPYIKMNPVRMGFLKAYINRSNRLKGQEEEIKMAWDETNTNPAYLCGALFAVLENIQLKAAGYNLNRTIKDAYFASASVRPALIFPRLIALSQHHLKKLEYSGLEEKNVEDLISKLEEEFPNLLSLKEQGVFMLGYYQKKSDIAKKIKEHKEAKEDK